MTTLKSILVKYRSEIDNLDLELLIAHELKQTREFVLTYPEWTVNRKQESEINKLITRRLNHEPLAYILGYKEFYGLNFKVTKDTLIPRPETELLIEEALEEIARTGKTGLNIVDVGTGSGNIIISIAKAIESKNLLHTACYMLYGVDISEKALKIAKCNAKKHKQDKIKFLKSNLLDHFLKNNEALKQFGNLIILANLPYLSKKIYSATLPTVKNFEPKSALYSPKNGLGDYEKLLKQIGNLKNSCFMLPACRQAWHVSCFMEISPEQKKDLTSLIKKILPTAKIRFKKDLAGKWRVCMFELI